MAHNQRHRRIHGGAQQDKILGIQPWRIGQRVIALPQDPQLSVEGQIAIHSGMDKQKIRMFDTPRQIGHHAFVSFRHGCLQSIQVPVWHAVGREGGFGIVILNPAPGEIQIGWCRQQPQRPHHGEFVIATQPGDFIVLRLQFKKDADRPGRIRPAIHHIADEQDPAFLNIGQPRQLADDLLQFCGLPVNIPDHRHGTIDTLWN